MDRVMRGRAKQVGGRSPAFVPPRHLHDSDEVSLLGFIATARATGGVESSLDSTGAISSDLYRFSWLDILVSTFFKL